MGLQNGDGRVYRKSAPNVDFLQFSNVVDLHLKYPVLSSTALLPVKDD